MATVTASYNWVSGETVTPTKLNTTAAPTVVVADNEVTTAKIADANVTQAKLAANTAGNGPAFRAAASAGTVLTSGGFTKVTLGSEDFDTNSNFASSRFTPTVAGYYQVNGRVYVAAAPAQLQAMVYKNGSIHSYGSVTSAGTFGSVVADLIYLNGTTDYIELYGYQLSGTNQTTAAGAEFTYMSAFLARAA